MSYKKNIGIIGAAKIVPRAIIQAAKEIEDVIVFGIAARDRKKAEKFANQYDIPYIFKDYDSLLNCDEIDIVYIPLSNDLHMPWVVKAARKKKHILVEKPICLNIKELNVIERTVEKHDIHLLEAIMVRHHPWQNKINEIIKNKIYGNLHSIKTHITFPFNDEENYRFFSEKGGGVFLDLGIYWIQFVQSCIGLQPESVEGKSHFNGPNGIDTVFEACMDFLGEVHTEFFASFKHPTQANHWLQFDKAKIRIRNFFRPCFGKQSINIEIYHIRTGKKEEISFLPQNYYSNQLEYFLHVIDGKKQNISLNESQERIKIMEDIYSSAKKNKISYCN